MLLLDAKFWQVNQIVNSRKIILQFGTFLDKIRIGRSWLKAKGLKNWVKP